MMFLVVIFNGVKQECCLFFSPQQNEIYTTTVEFVMCVTFLPLSACVLSSSVFVFLCYRLLFLHRVVCFFVLSSCMRESICVCM